MPGARHRRRPRGRSQGAPSLAHPSFIDSRNQRPCVGKLPQGEIPWPRLYGHPFTLNKWNRCARRFEPPARPVGAGAVPQLGATAAKSNAIEAPHSYRSGKYCLRRGGLVQIQHSIGEAKVNNVSASPASVLRPHP